MDTDERAVATAHFTQHATAEAIANARNWVTAFAEEHGLRPDRRADVALAVSEAVSNAVRHAYADGDAGKIDVDAATDGECLTVRIADRGFGHDGATSGLGFGLPLMAQVTDLLEVGPDASGTGTVVLMELDMGAARNGVLRVPFSR